MDVWEKYSLREEQKRNRRDNPSFSSTLLDAIYRSIDESNGKGEDELIFYRETMRKKHGNGLRGSKGEEEEEMASMQRACMIERWMEKKVSCEKVVVRRKSLADFERNNRNPRNDHFDAAVLLNSSSSSSESSCGGTFSSSESDSFYGAKSRSSSCYSLQRPKPIRTSLSSSARPERSQAHETDSYHHHHQKAPKHEGGFVKTKSKALKIYSDLKKVKQPISPGGRLASFINSLFTAGNAKKAKISSSSASSMYEERKFKAEPESTCSSASSFSRSCLSKTPSSSGKLSNGTKRSVRFWPVSVIVDEDSRPCGHKNLYENEQLQTARELQYHVMNESQRVQEAARELLKNYQKKKEGFEHMRDVCNVSNIEEESDVEDEEEEEEDDAASCASSDLFELDNLSAIGIQRYREELPVYETTHLDTNRAIASGLIL